MGTRRTGTQGMGTQRTDKRLEAGWFQRLAWALLPWVSLGLLVWVPFLYVAIRRGRPSDWGAFASFALYECITLPWAAVRGDGAGDPFLGIAVLLTLLLASGLLLFALFDKRLPKQPQRPQPQPQPMYGAAPMPPPPSGNPYLR